MKTIYSLSIALTMATFPFAGCKKDKADEDISSLFPNTVWTGDMKYNITPIPEPYIISFKNYGDLVWYERKGTYNGTYTIDKDEKTITIEAAGRKFKASVGS